MSDSKGFTLIEIIVVTVILGILAAVALPNYTTMITQQAARAAKNNLITIYNAQWNYYFTNGFYCKDTAIPPHICDTLTGSATSINTNLSLNIIDNNFTYQCKQGGGSANGFQCQATNISDNDLILTLTNNPIVLPGGTGCTGPTTWGTPCNPSCSTDVTAYCPN